MANIFQKLLKQPQIRQTLLTKSLNPTKPLNILPSQFVHQPQIKPHYNNLNPPNPILTTKDNFAQREFSHIYPVFPFGYFLDSGSQSGLVSVCEEKAEGLGSNEAGTMWADSVKKKRKKKMNKHKLRKLRKRLSRQT